MSLLFRFFFKIFYSFFAKLILKLKFYYFISFRFTKQKLIFLFYLFFLKFTTNTQKKNILTVNYINTQSVKPGTKNSN